ncbi:MAG: Trm112 family protein [Planctomycetota bacterium]
MIDKDLLQILACPETHQSLAEAEAALLTKLNERIAAGQAKNRAGTNVTEKLEGGLVRQDGKLVYPIREGIPVLLIDEAIPV